MSSRSPYWFRAKRYGWGWGRPATWQGWAVLAAYLGAISAPRMLDGARSRRSVATLAVATPVLLLVCAKKGDPPTWRWGNLSRSR